MDVNEHELYILSRLIKNCCLTLDLYYTRRKDWGIKKLRLQSLLQVLPRWLAVNDEGSDLHVYCIWCSFWLIELQTKLGAISFTQWSAHSIHWLVGLFVVYMYLLHIANTLKQGISNFQTKCNTRKWSISQLRDINWIMQANSRPTCTVGNIRQFSCQSPL